MPKLPNLLDTRQITISTNPVVEEKLERLLTTGFYGKNVAEAAERLVAVALQQLEADGQLPDERAERETHLERPG